MNRGEIESAFYVELGRKIAAKRKACKMSMRALGVEVGVHRNTVYRWEVGTGIIGPWHLLRLCDVLHCHFPLMLPAPYFTWGGELAGAIAERDPYVGIQKERDPTYAEIRRERDPNGPDLHKNRPQINS